MSKVMQQYRLNGTAVMPHKTQEGSVVDRIPAGYYKVRFDKFIGFFLTKEANEVVVPENIYGSAPNRANRIWNAFDKSDAPLGVGLFGTKGAGKTMLSNLIAKEAIEERGLPVIDVSDNFTSDPSYLEFLNSLGNVVIIFDEFIKRLGNQAKDNDARAYDTNDVAKKRQDEMLPFFSGTNNSKRLIIMIDNSSHALSDFIRDRPGRMRYIFNYSGVEETVVRALCQDNNINSGMTDELVTYATKFRCSFDMVNEIIKEIVEYPDESLADLTKIMNVPSMVVFEGFKGQVSNLKYIEGPLKDAEIINELVSVSDTGSFILPVSLKNPLKEVDITSEEEFDDKAYYKVMSWSNYLKFKGKDTFETVFSFSSSNLKSIKGNKRIYQNDIYSVVLEVLNTDKTFQSFDWDYNFT